MNPTRGFLAGQKEILRQEMTRRDEILACLAEGPLTVPEVAARLQAPTQHVMYWMMAMRRYGLILEKGRPNEHGYFAYQIKPKEDAHA